ncbi:type II restriction endonuclease [Shewanella polaris]|uniref:Restriction endonuclease n=1 Tax=Shewanella polaris TaxID=2588449 RepID=A0A4Y5YAM4_9GAMM|nr:type II restriction endonuclease [Shewanella polaris]QDE29573.1 restriction endonuclease [Shewanella polaris]
MRYIDLGFKFFITTRYKVVFSDWLSSISSTGYSLYIKRLSANDTGASGGHQVGVYVPKNVMDNLFPSLNVIDRLNPDLYFKAVTLSHDFDDKQVRAIYYNNRFFGKTRNEKRITGWGGRKSPLQNPDNTGALALFAFVRGNKSDCVTVQVWVCSTIEDEDFLEQSIGEVLPGECLFGPSSNLLSGFKRTNPKESNLYKIPDAWRLKFPSGEELIKHLAEVYTFKAAEPDDLLIERRDVEYTAFKKIEEFHVLDKIRDGFDTVDDFVNLANSVSNRRKSRSGKSLELHLEHIFQENGITNFTSQCVTEANKKPDFIFPSCDSYHNKLFPRQNLRMLAVKTTCKDRWRQIINEADDIKIKHLFTLQEGVSINQYAEMKLAGVKLVVPKSLHRCYPEQIRGDILSLIEFMTDVRVNCFDLN